MSLNQHCKSALALVAVLISLVVVGRALVDHYELYVLTEQLTELKQEELELRKELERRYVRTDYGIKK